VNTPSPTHPPYRQGVGILLLNPNNHVFVAKRIDMRSEAWQMPQGGIDAGETPKQAALRELKEEIGTDKGEILQESGDWFTYDLPDTLIPIIWGGKYRGQKQKWFAMRFTGTDADINIATEHPEFCEWKWTPLHSLPDIIVPFKRDIYTQIVREFENLVA
jgi:putative (di)nucleoside polyphosphate hydrolase